MTKKQIEIRFKIPVEYFEVYADEAKLINEQTEASMSATARVRAEAIKQAKAKLKETTSERVKESDVMSVFEGL